jgi:hypothetical protein
MGKQRLGVAADITPGNGSILTFSSFYQEHLTLVRVASQNMQSVTCRFCAVASNEQNKERNVNVL